MTDCCKNIPTCYYPWDEKDTPTRLREAADEIESLKEQLNKARAEARVARESSRNANMVLSQTKDELKDAIGELCKQKHRNARLRDAMSSIECSAWTHFFNGYRFSRRREYFDTLRSIRNRAFQAIRDNAL